MGASTVIQSTFRGYKGRKEAALTAAIREKETFVVRVVGNRGSLRVLRGACIDVLFPFLNDWYIHFERRQRNYKVTRVCTRPEMRLIGA